MLVRLLTGGLVGGLAGGIVVAAIQAVTTTPLILEAERYEGVETAVAALLLVHDHAPAAAEGLDIGRLAMTAFATIAVATGYLLMLLGALWIKGGPIDARRTTLWAVAGFFVTGLAPAFGLAPELPGAAYVDLADRQLWWAGTAVATALGIAAIAFGRGLPWVLAGVILIALPHVIGAPATLEHASRVPAELAAHFAASSLVVQALTWIVPAAIAGFLLQRLSKGEPAAA